jgi:hypothetical protein
MRPALRQASLRQAVPAGSFYGSAVPEQLGVLDQITVPTT